MEALLPFEDDDAVGMWAAEHRWQRIRVSQLRRQGLPFEAIAQKINQEYEALVRRRCAWQEEGELCEVHNTDIIDGKCWCIKGGCPKHHTNVIKL